MKNKKGKKTEEKERYSDGFRQEVDRCANPTALGAAQRNTTM